MPRHRQTAWHLATSLAVAVLLVTAPSTWVSRQAVALEGCTLADAIRSTTCRLLDGTTTDGTLDPATGRATYRVDVFSPDSTLDLVLAGGTSGTSISVLDWRGTAIGTATRGDDAPDVQLSAKLPLPGTYAVCVTTDASAEGPPYALTARIQPPVDAARLFWPPPLVQGAGPLRDERQVLTTPRAGTPTTPSVRGLALGAPPDGMLTDFTFVSDVQFKKIVGPSGLTVRFRDETEAGGGSGYLLRIDPFGGTVSLDAFEEGQRRPIVADRPLTIVPTADGPNRLILMAAGPSIRATLDGEPLIEATDSRFTRGLIVVEAVTWSDPVEVTFDHIQVTTTPR